MTYKYLIIGGGVAGVTAAETIRLNDATGTIAIISDEPYLLYSRVMLSKPNFFLEKVPFDQIWLKGQEWYKEKGIEFIGGKTVTGINPSDKKIILNDGGNISYEKLLIAIGTETRKASMPGADKKGIHYLKTLEDGKEIMGDIKGKTLCSDFDSDAVNVNDIHASSLVRIKSAKSAVTVGGGFIGFEMAELMKMAGMKTTVVVREPYFWALTLDQASGAIIETAMKKTGLEIIHNNEIIEITGGERVDGVILKDGTKIACEIIVFGIGTVSHLDWIKSAGIDVNHGILANEYMETNVKDIWTAGDIAEYKDLILEENVQMGNWVSAHEQGRIAGLGMVDKKEPFKFVSFYTTQGFGIAVAFVGDATPKEDRQVIVRSNPEKNSLGRLLIVGKELVGATLINRTQEMGTISKLIEKNVDVSGHLAELGDAGFDLKSLF